MIRLSYLSNDFTAPTNITLTFSNLSMWFPFADNRDRDHWENRDDKYG